MPNDPRAEYFLGPLHFVRDALMSGIAWWRYAGIAAASENREITQIDPEQQRERGKQQPIPNVQNVATPPIDGGHDGFEKYHHEGESQGGLYYGSHDMSGFGG